MHYKNLKYLLKIRIKKNKLSKRLDLKMRVKNVKN